MLGGLPQPSMYVIIAQVLQNCNNHTKSLSQSGSASECLSNRQCSNVVKAMLMTHAFVIKAASFVVVIGNINVYFAGHAIEQYVSSRILLDDIVSDVIV